MVLHSLNHIFRKSGSSWVEFVRKTGVENLLIVGVDVGKYSHKGMICSFYGDILVKPFDFANSNSGFRTLESKINAVKSRLGAREVVVGVEATGHYHENLVSKCFKAGYRVRVLNAVNTAQVRKRFLNRSKTDNLDLRIIVDSVRSGWGNDSLPPEGVIRDLQKLDRARRSLVNERTRLKNKIRTNVDHIFPEFQGKEIWENGKKRKVKPFSNLFGKASRYIMRHCLHPSDILALGEKGLRELSVKENLKLRDSNIQTLLEFAEDSIARPKEEVEVYLFLLKHELEALELKDKQIKELERKIEDLYVQSEGAVLLSVPGIGVVTGAALYAEMGDLSKIDYAGQLIKMAGTNPVVKQSGGKRATYMAISKQGRRNFRNVVYLIGRSLAENNPEMKKKYHEFIKRGKFPRQAYIALGNRMIRIAFSMIKNQTLYRTNHENYDLHREIKKKLQSANAKRFFERYVKPSSLVA